MKKSDLNIMSDEEVYEYRKNLLKTEFTLDDFLSCEETCEILSNEHYWDYEKKCLPQIENFYEKTLFELRNKSSTTLYYDIHNDFAGELSGMVYKNIKKEYDLNIFYDCPDLANPLIGKANQPLSTKNIKKKVNIVNLSSNTNKKFDWESKTYK